MRYIQTLFLSFFVFALSAQTIKPTDNGSEIFFSINNFGLSTKGSLSGLSGSIIWNTADLKTASFNVSVASKTINTDNRLRDEHLKKSDYFNVEKFPVINIQSNQIITGNKPGEFIMEATLTIKGVSKKINFPFNVISQNGNTIFGTNFEINRRDFGIGGGSISLSNTVKISLKVVAY
ncbi:MAG: YceI family protein [Sphingobacteriia bacterium]|jgi:polyisoprenoid-binding protein YceI